MTSNIIKADARIVQTVRKLKEQPNLKQDKKLSNISDKSSDNTHKRDHKIGSVPGLCRLRISDN